MPDDPSSTRLAVAAIILGLTLLTFAAVAAAVLLTH